MKMMDLDVDAVLFGKALNTLEKLEAREIAIKEFYIESLLAHIDKTASKLQYLAMSKDIRKQIDPTYLQLSTSNIKFCEF